MTDTTKKTERMKKAWLVQWGCHAQDEEVCLKRLGINEKIVDVISVRKDFDRQIIDIANAMYAREMLSFSEKMYLANYSLGEKRKNTFFGVAIPIFTHFTSDIYRNLNRSIHEKGLDHEDTKKLLDQWSRSPQYIMVGHNPYLEIIKVSNLIVSRNERNNEVIEWYRPLANGGFKYEMYEFKN